MPKLLLVGCGKMGGAILRGIASAVDCIVVVEPTPSDEVFPKNVAVVTSPENIAPEFVPDAVIVAVKPQSMAKVLPLYAPYRSSVFLSIAAGQTLRRLAALLDDPNRAIVRAMPNLPASIGKGISVAVANFSVTQLQRSLCEQILSAAGEVAWVEDEALIDPVTALSGSGPAYVFALIETMARAGEQLGLAPELAAKLARQTVVGSGALLAHSVQTATALRHAVTSPGGTTEAALNVLLSEKGLPVLMSDAMKAASLRAKELSA